MATRHMGNSRGSQSVFMCKGTRRGTLATRLCDNFCRRWRPMRIGSQEKSTAPWVDDLLKFQRRASFKTRLRSRQNRIADILKLVSDPAPFSPHLLIISRLLLKNNTRIPSDPSRIPSDFLTPLPRVLLIFRNSTEVGSRRIPSRIPSILQHLLSQMRILVWRTYSYYNSN